MRGLDDQITCVGNLIRNQSVLTAIYCVNLRNETEPWIKLDEFSIKIILNPKGTDDERYVHENSDEVSLENGCEESLKMWQQLKCGYSVLETRTCAAHLSSGYFLLLHNWEMVEYEMTDNLKTCGEPYSSLQMIHAASEILIQIYVFVNHTPVVRWMKPI